jgi:hypothetical protein
MGLGPGETEVIKQGQEALELIEEITTITLSAGPAGIARGLKAFDAVFSLGQVRGGGGEAVANHTGTRQPCAAAVNAPNC